MGDEAAEREERGMGLSNTGESACNDTEGETYREVRRGSAQPVPDVSGTLIQSGSFSDHDRLADRGLIARDQ